MVVALRLFRIPQMMRQVVVQTLVIAAALHPHPDLILAVAAALL